MKKHSQLGGKKGKPAYRTPSVFIAKKSLKAPNLKSQRKGGQHRG